MVLPSEGSPRVPDMGRDIGNELVGDTTFTGVIASV
jgi:hypothetical protein